MPFATANFLYLRTLMEVSKSPLPPNRSASARIEPGTIDFEQMELTLAGVSLLLASLS